MTLSSHLDRRRAAIRAAALKLWKIGRLKYLDGLPLPYVFPEPDTEDEEIVEEEIDCPVDLDDIDGMVNKAIKKRTEDAVVRGHWDRVLERKA